MSSDSRPDRHKGAKPKSGKRTAASCGSASASESPAPGASQPRRSRLQVARSHIFSRADLFYWRRRLPLTLARTAGRTHLCRALGTGERALARVRALNLSAAFEETFLAHQQTLKTKRSLQPWEAEQILRELYARIFEECERWAATRPKDIGFLDPTYTRNKGD